MVRKLPGQPLSVNRPIVSVSGTLTAATIICNHLVAFYGGPRLICNLEVA